MALGKNKVDTILAITIVGLVLFGIVMIYSASVIVGFQYFGDDKYFFKRQIVWAIAGLIAMATTANIDFRFWKKWAGPMLAVTLVLLLSVFLFHADAIYGAHRWIVIAGQSFQPSELAKFTFLVYLSAWLAARRGEISSFSRTFLPFLVVVGAVSLLMLKQPDFGTLSIMLASAIAVYVVAGMTWQQLVAGVGVTAGALMLIIAEPYRRARLTTFLNPSQDTGGISYHAENIAIAIGSGNWLGLGFGNSRQKRLFLPEPHTDSIFAIITEELGFLIASLLILVFVLLVYRGYRIAMNTKDPFGKLLAVGITSWFAFQAFINLASMLHIVPLVGVPLPFISYGGTNLLISLASAGVLLNISRTTNEVVAVAPAPRRRGRQRS